MQTSIIALTMLGVVGCGSAQLPRSNGFCRSIADQPVRVEIRVGERRAIPSPCLPWGKIELVSDLELAATVEGLEVHAQVSDAAFRPGPYLKTDGARDVVVLFPSGQLPGRPFVELQTSERAEPPFGFMIDDRVEWSQWGLAGPNGRFPFLLSIFDREGNGTETEIRFSIEVVVRER